ncbi:hypothetical protein [Foetidibacter luteolus]|uniref:hypothetical protein n=1 Tax=Foetidibacter luteolus TaxID=2608880 RepID=UPI00129BACB0|nr:hypothetical protein [Foetidibacter luteolus]
MKYLFLLSLIYVTTVQAQSTLPPPERQVSITHYALDSFHIGTVLLKSGGRQQYLLNYNTLTQEMIFERGGIRLAMAHPEDVDTVYILDKKFVFVNKVFYEVLATTPVALYGEYKCRVLRTGSQLGYGITSAAAGNTGISSLINGGKAYDLTLPYEYQVKMKQELWLRKGYNYYKANSLKQVILVFPGKEKLIRQLSKQKEIDFTKPQDIIALVKEVQM